MVLKCPSCSQTFTVPDDVTTGKAKCPHCGQRLDLGRMLRPGDLRPGTVLGGCRIEGLLGRGGMAVVYKARQVSLDRPVALKVLPTRFASNREFVERFNREASALALLSHPNIVSILDKGVQGDTYYFVMEYVEGKSLRDRLLREERLSPQETRQLMHGICAGLAYAHENGIVHRDLKPGNILLDASGKPKLADFGIARLTGADTHDALQLTAAHTVMGSADYMAPEQRADAAKADHRADIYSLGVMLYQMLTGSLPVGSFKPAAHLVRGLPTAVDRVIRTALAAEPDDRFESVNKFLHALDRAFEETGMRHTARAAAQARREGITPAAAVLIALAVLIVLAGLLAIVISGGPSHSSDQHAAKQQHASKVPRPSPPPATRHVVPPKPPDPKTSRPPDGEDAEPPAVRTALAEARQHIAANPDDYPGQVQRLRDVLENSRNPQVLAAARKEMAAVNERLNKAIADHFAAARKRADALMEQRAYGAAVRLAGVLPPHLFTSEAKKQAEALSQEYRGKCWTAYENDRKRAISLAEEGRLQEAIAALTADYPSFELQKMASEEILKLKDALAAKQKQAREEQVRRRAELAAQLKGLWAQRRYAEALAAANDALAKAPDAECREALAPHVRAATLLDAFWKAVIEALAARKGQTFTIAGSKYMVKDVEGDNLILALGPATTSRRISAFSAEELHNIARDWLDPAKKADDNLALALFLTYDAKPDPAAATRAFDKALSLGAGPGLVAAIRDITAASQAPEPPEPKAKEPEPVAGYALDLNGASNYVEVPDDPRNKRSLRPKSFTLEAWVWRRPGPGEALPRCIAAKNAGWTNAPSFALYVQDGCWAYATGDGVEIDSVVTRTPCVAGDWTHAALTYDEAGLRTLFVDGKQVHRSRARRPISYDNQPLYVGALRLDGNPAHFWPGGIDEVRLTNGLRYTRDFVPERLAKADDQTLLFLRFDEGRGPKAKDSSLYDNDGHLRGGAAFLPPADFKLRRPGPPPKALPLLKQPPAEALPPKAPAP